jgi:hypothetical protein
MTALYIIGGILLFVFAVGMVRVEAVILYAADFSMTVRAAGIPVYRLPGRKKKIRLRDYSPRAMEKKRRKAEKKAEKKAAAKAKKEEKKRRKKESGEGPAGKGHAGKKDIRKIVSLVTELLEVLLKRFGKHLRIRVARLHVNVATGDAASTAVVYGCVAQAVAYLGALLDRSGNLRGISRSDVDVRADFLAEATACDIEIGFSLRVWQVFDMINRTGARFIKELIRSNGQLF